MHKLQVGLAGLGFIGPAHLEALRRNNIPVLGLVGSSPAQAHKRAQELGVEKAYASFAELIADPEITVVHLATPNFLHFPQAMAALLAGKHVVCEKPLAMNTTESAELVRLAADKKLLNAVNYNLRFYPLVQEARSLVQSGELGDLFILQGSYLQDWLLFPTDWNWRLDPQLGGSLRAVADIGSHWLDLMSFITGLRVQQALAEFKTFHPVRKKPARPVDTFSGKLLQPSDYIDQPVNTEDYATILLRYDQGVNGVVTVSQVSAGRKNRLFFEINGARQSLAWDSEHPNDMWIGRRDAPNGLLMKDPALLSPGARAVTSYPGGHQEGFPDTFKQFTAKVYSYLRAGDMEARPDFPTFADGHYEMQLCEAIERSAHDNSWTKVT